MAFLVVQQADLRSENWHGAGISQPSARGPRVKTFMFYEKIQKCLTTYPTLSSWSCNHAHVHDWINWDMGLYRSVPCNCLFKMISSHQKSSKILRSKNFRSPVVGVSGKSDKNRPSLPAESNCLTGKVAWYTCQCEWNRMWSHFNDYKVKGGRWIEIRLYAVWDKNLLDIWSKVKYQNLPVPEQLIGCSWGSIILFRFIMFWIQII